MRIFLLGATGKTGSFFMKMALESGNHVTAYVRSPEKVMVVDANLDIVKGDLLSATQMSTAMTKHDVVVSCLGGNDNNKATVIRDLTSVIIDSMNKCNVRRIVSISTAGIHNEFSWMTNLILNLFYKHVINDHRLAAELIMTSGFEYTLARPLSLTDGKLKKDYRKTSSGVPKGGKELSRQDLAHFLLDAIENEGSRNKSVGLAY